MPLVQVRVEELLFEVQDSGPQDAEAIVLLHGFPQSSHVWRLVSPLLVGAGYRVIAPDQRGYSRQARPEDPTSYEMPHLLGDVLGLLDGLQVDRAHVVGHDWGAAIAWQLAARHPDRVRSLTAVSVPHPLALTEALGSDDDQRKRSEYIWQFRHQKEIERELLDGGLRDLFGGAGPGVDVQDVEERMAEPGALTAGLNWYRGMQRRDNDELQPVTVPTLFVWSDEDVALGRTAAEATRRFVQADYRFEVLRGVSHWIPEEEPATLASLVLSRISAS